MAQALNLPESADSSTRPRVSAWFLLCALLLPALYLPTLATPFDFIDDGNLVYPTTASSRAERVHAVWQKIIANYEHLGPFRPTLWLHWETFAELWQGNELGWRLTRLIWCAWASAMLLWLLLELRVAPLPAWCAAAVAMWNPYRNEIWTSLTLAEGVAMPYALLALVCARRATHSPRSLGWDLLGAACMLVALGCKNTFAALVPAQVFLRVATEGMSLRQGWRYHRRSAVLLASLLVLPISHYIYFKLNWHPGQYTPSSPTLAQLRRILSGLQGAISAEYLGVGVLLAVIAVRAARLEEFLSHYRAALGAGALLLSGIVEYLPMDAMSGRYTMPAVWGLDLMLAVLLSAAAGARVTVWKRAAWLALGVGLIAVAAANVGKQQKFAARARLLWDALAWVETHAPDEARVAWVTGKDGVGLNAEEGIHFQWHLEARGRRDVRVGLYDEAGQPLTRVEVPPLDREPLYRISGAPPSSAVPGWEIQRFVVSYWREQRHFACYLAKRSLPARLSAN